MESVVIPKCLLDTDMLSEAMKGRDPSVMKRAAEYEAVYEIFTISSVSLMELVKGFEKTGRLDVLDGLLADMPDIQILPFDGETARIAGRIAGGLEVRGMPVGRADPMIAAVAIQHGMVLVTGNTAHFQRMRDIGYPLQIDNWRKQ